MSGLLAISRLGSQGLPWDSRLLCKLAQTGVPYNVTDNAPATVAGPAKLDLTPHIPTAMNMAAETPELGKAFGATAKAIGAGTSPRAAVQANRNQLAQGVIKNVTATPQRAQQAAQGWAAGQYRKGNYGAALGATAGRYWSKADNFVRSNPAVTGLAMLNPLTAPMAMAAGASALTGAGDRALNAGIGIGVNRKIDEAIPRIPDTPVSIPQELNPMVNSTIDFATSNPEFLRSPQAQKMLQGFAQNPAGWKGVAANNAGTIAKYAPQVIRSNPGAVKQTVGNYVNKALNAVGFQRDQGKGYWDSFMNNPGNKNFRYGAGGIGVMALLWLLSRMGRR